MIFRCFVALLVFFTEACALAAPREDLIIPKILESGDGLEFRYFDPFYERRTPLEVGNIDETYDFAVNVRCNGLNCRTALPWVTSLLIGARATDTPCEGAKYMRIKVNFEGRTVETMYSDMKGTCLWYRGRFLRVKSDIIKAIRTRALANW